MSRPRPHDVTERRLRPIYEAIDARNFKKAHQLADKLIRKNQDAPSARVLKALTFLRTGREKEAYVAVESVTKKLSEFVYEPLLQAMSLFYREAHRFERIAEVFELAVQHDPKNEEYLSHLFMAYVRIGKYQKQQEVGRTLYKQFPQTPYYYWSVMSIVMQAYTCQDHKLSKTMYLPLAQKMIEKQIKSGGVDSEAEMKLYVSVLERQEKYEDALFVLRGVLGGSYKNSHEKEVQDLEFVWKLGRWAELNKVAESQLKKNPDDWNIWLAYIESAVEMAKMDAPIQSKEETPDGEKQSGLADPEATVEQAGKFIKAAIDAEQEKRKGLNRGPFLIPFELVKLARARMPQLSGKFGLPSLVDLVVTYFDHFGDRRACHSDVDPYLCLLSDNEKRELVLRVRLFVAAVEREGREKDDLSDGVALKIMQRHIFSVQLARSLGEHEKLSVEEKMDLVKEMKERLSNGQKYRASFLETDVCPMDTYAQLAVHVLANLYEETGENIYLWESIHLLENIVRKGCTNAQLKLLLVKLYCHFGAFDPCCDIYKTLDIRSIQLDSLGYLFIPVAVTLGHFGWGRAIVQPILLFFFNHVKECPEYVITAYHNGTFQKIIEMTDFQRRIQHSLTFAIDVYESATLEMMANSNTLQWAYSLLYSLNLQPFTAETEANLSDNRDLFVMDSWDPPHRRMTEEKAKASTQIEIRWLNLRATLFHMLWVATGAVETLYSADPLISAVERIMPFSLEEETEKLGEYLQEFKEAFVKAEEFPELSTEFPFLQGPPPCRLQHFLKCGYLEMIEVMVPLFRAILLAADKKWPQEAADECCKLTEGLPKVAALFEERRKKVVSVLAPQYKVASGWAIRQVVQLTETFCHTTLYVCMCNKIITTNRTKKRSRVERVAEPMLKALKEFQKDLMESIDRLKGNIHDIKRDAMFDMKKFPIFDKDISKESFIKIDYSSVEGIKESVRECSASALQEVCYVLGTKLLLSVKMMKW